MLGKSIGVCAVLVLTGAVAACSSSSGGTTPTPDGGKTGEPDAHKGGGKDAGHDAMKMKMPGHDAGNDVSAPSGPTARFKYDGTTVPNLLDVPFPSDVYLTAGKVVGPIPGADAVMPGGQSTFFTGELGRLNGFSPIAQSLFYVDDPAETDGVAAIDPTSLPTNEAACVADGSSVFLLDLTATGAAQRVPCRAAFHDDRMLNMTAGMTGYRPNVSVGPGRGYVLPAGHVIAAVLTSRLKTTAGKSVGASADFLALAKDSDYANALEKVQTLLGTALAKDTVVDLALYTTHTNTDVLIQMRTNLESVAVPTLAWDAASLMPMGNAKFGAGLTASLDDYFGKVTAPKLAAPPLLSGIDDPNAGLPVHAHDKLAAIGTAVFQAQNYLSPSLGYSTVGGATFGYDAMGNVVPDKTNPTRPIWVTFFVPTAPMPAGGYPVVIVQHGLGESRQDEPFNLANTFAAQGWMVAAIDSVTFGARSIASAPVDMVNNFAAGGGKYSGPDGLADEPTAGLPAMFGNLVDLGAIRDQFRQASFDTSQLARVLASNPDLGMLKTGAKAPAIDPTRIAYVGNSLGGIEGATAAAIEPLIKNFVLNVAGGGILLELAAHSARVAVDLELAGRGFGAGADHLTESHPLMNFMQQVVDPGDPLLYAPFVVQHPATVNGKALPPKNILQVEVLYDEFVPNEADEALARALGIGLAVPNVGSNVGVSTLAMVQDSTKIPDPIAFPNVMPDGTMLIHDTPLTGTTSVLVQTSPGTHGDDLMYASSQHAYAIPLGRFTTATPFVLLSASDAGTDPVFSVDCSYAQLQAMSVRFLTDGFAGKVPNVTGFPTPVRDYDGDGVPDSTDTDPNDPNVH